jgi:outer membrane receptor protein involved in Fe transport
MVKKTLVIRLVKRPLVLAASLILFALPNFAQEGRSTLRGTITDSTGAAIPDAQVSVSNQSTGLNRRTTMTTSDGDFIITALTPGLYRITVAASGFRSATQESLQLAVGETRELKITLEPGGAAESVNVTAEAPIIATTSKEIGGNINQRELIELPSVNRNFIGFVGLLPGVVPNISTESFGSDSVSINGQDPRFNNFLLDGANNNDDVIGQRAGAQTRTALEAVQEFQVITNQFDAQYGRTSGGIINAITKSGTNVFHGSGFGYFQDNSLNSSNRFAELNQLEEPNTNMKQWGGTIGGPIKRDLAHFFFSFERTTINEGIIIDIPSRPELNATTTENTKATNTTLRFDTQPSDRDQIAVRWLRESSPQFNQIIGNVTLDAAREEADIDQTYVGSWTSTFTSSLLNDLRINFTREDVAFANPNFNAGNSMADLLPTLQFANFTAQQSNVAQARINNSYRAADTVSWIRNKHSFKFGLEYNYVTADNINEGDLNGRFIFPTNLPFDPSNPSTYPNRLVIRVPGAQKFVQINHNTSLFAQDAWKVNNQLTLNLGVRWDDETISDDNNNISPRLGFAYDIGGAGKTVIRGGFGFFYQATPFELITAFRTSGPFSDSFTRNFPLSSADPGPTNGQFPTDPTLRNGPVVDRALIRSLVGAGTLLPNPSPFVDNNERVMPYVRSYTAGIQQQLTSTMALTADYIHQDGVDQFVQVNLNPGVRASTVFTAAIQNRPFNTLGELVKGSFIPVNTSLFSNLAFDPLAVSTVSTRINRGRTDYDALQLSLDKRLSQGFQFKVSYTLSKGTGNVSGSGVPTANFQLRDQLNLELDEGPTDFDRRHNFVVSGFWEVPFTRGLIVSTVVRRLSGTPFTIFDGRVDADQNGINFDPLAAASFNSSRTFANGETLSFNFDNDGGRNGAVNPGFFAADLRLAYKYNFTERIIGGFTFEIFNITNRTNFDGVSGNFNGGLSAANFLIPTSAQTPRTMQLGFRVSF